MDINGNNLNNKKMIKVNVGKFGDIITSRPKGMSYETYRTKRKEMCLKLHGYNTMVGDKKVHVLGRLEGIAIPSENWTNSKDVRVIIK